MKKNKFEIPVYKFGNISSNNYISNWLDAISNNIYIERKINYERFGISLCFDYDISRIIWR